MEAGTGCALWEHCKAQRRSAHGPLDRSPAHHAAGGNRRPPAQAPDPAAAALVFTPPTAAFSTGSGGDSGPPLGVAKAPIGLSYDCRTTVLWGRTHWPRRSGGFLNIAPGDVKPYLCSPHHRHQLIGPEAAAARRQEHFAPAVSRLQLVNEQYGGWA